MILFPLFPFVSFVLFDSNRKEEERRGELRFQRAKERETGTRSKEERKKDRISEGASSALLFPSSRPPPFPLSFLIPFLSHLLSASCAVRKGEEQGRGAAAAAALVESGDEDSLQKRPRQRETKLRRFGTSKIWKKK